MATSILDKDLITGLPMSIFARPTSNGMPQRTGGSNAEGHTPGRGLSVSEIMHQRENRSNAYDPRTGQPVAPGTILRSPGWNTSGVGPGTRGYRGSGRLGSAAGAVGSAGVPTSQRGRAEKYGDAFAEMPTWAMSDLMRENMGGLSQSWRFGNMGQLPADAPQAPTPTAGRNALMQEAGQFQAVEQPQTAAPNSQVNRTPYGSQGSDWFSALLGQFLPAIF